MSDFQQDIDAIAALRAQQGGTWDDINPEYAARMKLQNRFRTGLEIARYTADIMRKDMADYDADSSQYTQSLGCWHGFIGQQKLIVDQEAPRAPPTSATSTCPAGWSPRCVRSSARCPTSPCTRRPRFPS